MVKVEFDETSSTFVLIRESESVPYRYYPNFKDVWDNLEDNNFKIVLLNNPFLNRELNQFEIYFDGSNERGGFIFPITLLESEEEHKKPLLSYMLVAYRTLLSMIIGEATGVLSDSYKDAFVLAIHNEFVPNFSLEDYCISLANYGFYEYIGVIKDKSQYPSVQYIKALNKKLHLEKSVQNNCSNVYVKDLIRNKLCTTTDVLTRFVLVYQVVELYISEIHKKLLDESIDKYKNEEYTKNEFSEKLKEISRESYQIKQLVYGLDTEEQSEKYKKEIIGLFNDVGYKPKNENIETLLYALRNQIFHNYGLFVNHEDCLTQVIFSFERLILMILSKKSIVSVQK